MTKWKPVSNGSVFTPAVDQRYGRLGVRYSLSDGMHINVYSLAAARTGDFSTVLASFTGDRRASLFYRNELV